MENKEMKKPIPVELEGEELDNVSGGVSDDCATDIPAMGITPALSCSNYVCSTCGFRQATPEYSRHQCAGGIFLKHDCENCRRYHGSPCTYYMT